MPGARASPASRLRGSAGPPSCFAGGAKSRRWRRRLAFATASAPHAGSCVVGVGPRCGGRGRDRSRAAAGQARRRRRAWDPRPARREPSRRLRRRSCWLFGRATGRATGRGAHAEDLAEGPVQHLELVERDRDPDERALERAATGGDAQGRAAARCVVRAQCPDQRTQARAPGVREAPERVDRRPAPGGGPSHLVRAGQREGYQRHSPVSLGFDGQALQRRGASGDGLEGEDAQAEVALEKAVRADEVAGEAARHLPALAGGAGGKPVQAALQEIAHPAVAAMTPQTALCDGHELAAVVVVAGVVTRSAAFDALDAGAQAALKVQGRATRRLGRVRCQCWDRSHGALSEAPKVPRRARGPSRRHAGSRPGESEGLRRRGGGGGGNR